MAIKTCKKCKKTMFNGDVCNCKPFVIISELGDVEQYGTDVDDVLEKFAEKHNQEGELMNDTMDVLVDGRAYRIGAEPSVNYIVTEL